MKEWIVHVLAFRVGEMKRGMGERGFRVRIDDAALAGAV